ncbi:MAG: aminoacyl-tRNA hydrolase [Opitutaceae bacterium]|nr:aminoacyl-tRNA hydrolase [Opitutaceae bacterium]
MSIALVAGLGNPGREYDGTRHNLGWIVLDALARRQHLHWKSDSRFAVETARWDAGGLTLHLVKPQSFMNDSGRPLRQFASFHKVPTSSITVAYDDAALELGSVKVSVTGSAGGHNGVASLLEHLGDGFVRYRMGIGPKQPPQMDIKDFVLGSFTLEQRQLLTQKLDRLVDGLELLIREGPDRAMNQLNRRDKNEPDQTQLPRDLHPG